MNERTKPVTARDFFLETARLRIRPLREADFEALYRIFCDAEMMRWVGQGTAFSRIEARERLLKHIERMATTGYGLLAVELKETGEVIGDSGLFPVEGDPPEVEVAYHFVREHHGRGYATEAARAVLEYGFGAMGLERIVAFCYPENIASKRVMLKIGMRELGRAMYKGIEVEKCEGRGNGQWAVGNRQ